MVLTQGSHGGEEEDSQSRACGTGRGKAAQVDRYCSQMTNEQTKALAHETTMHGNSLQTVPWSFLASLSVDSVDDGVRQVAQTLQSCLELKEPVQQIQLVKKVSHKTDECVSGMNYIVTVEQTLCSVAQSGPVFYSL